MATLYHHLLPSFHSLSPPKITSSFHPTPSYSAPNRRHNSHYSTISASVVKKSPRASRKPKSDEELCNDIKCFLSSVGLPQNHVPTMKELSLYGRQDLANIVRRRGYKYIRQLLETSSTENFIGSDTETSQIGNPEILGENDKQNVLFVGVPSDLTIEEDTNSFIGEDEGLQINDQSSPAADSLSLQEKVARFIQLGELDASEDGEGSTSEEKGDEEGKTIESENSNEPEFALSMLNGISTASALKVEEPALETITSRNSSISTEEQTNTSGEDMDDEKQKAENQSYINHLRFLLYEKERELAQLKEQIEKEKLALSLLHSKAEEEISNAHELISEKENELHEAEEIFSGLTEVEIQYSGEAKTVELAGSFNGWHQKIPMESQSTSSSVTYPTESRTSQDWRVLLWLYHGVYEIKFVVDGDWKIDPERETVSRNGVHNNILRVDSVDDPATV
ncbi:protein PTST homolog 3, chloroplastic-like isoform X3 [Salvia splendens]|uniref:protein PTST homolog 3, chloroplastic-like isoform X3 n=1 Tax=Salvia splendens TaxID=180675 RepID=UPI001C262A1F|nr:protein PTST homolog 3, chloroplastic-like isoform X3 [Salvia splendens]